MILSAVVSLTLAGVPTPAPSGEPIINVLPASGGTSDLAAGLFGLGAAAVGAALAILGNWLSDSRKARADAIIAQASQLHADSQRWDPHLREVVTNVLGTTSAEVFMAAQQRKDFSKVVRTFYVRDSYYNSSLLYMVPKTALFFKARRDWQKADAKTFHAFSELDLIAPEPLVEVGKRLMAATQALVTLSGLTLTETDYDDAMATFNRVRFEFVTAGRVELYIVPKSALATEV
jgi:hypothetical protein